VRGPRVRWPACDPALALELAAATGATIIYGAAADVHFPPRKVAVGELDPGRPVVASCAGGYRSSIAASLLRASGFADVSDLIGGYQAWQAAA